MVADYVCRRQAGTTTRSTGLGGWWSSHVHQCRNENNLQKDSYSNKGSSNIHCLVCRGYSVIANQYRLFDRCSDADKTTCQVQSFQLRGTFSKHIMTARATAERTSKGRAGRRQNARANKQTNETTTQSINQRTDQPRN